MSGNQPSGGDQSGLAGGPPYGASHDPGTQPYAPDIPPYQNPPYRNPPEEPSGNPGGAAYSPIPGLPPGGAPGGDQFGGDFPFAGPVAPGSASAGSASAGPAGGRRPRSPLTIALAVLISLAVIAVVAAVAVVAASRRSDSGSDPADPPAPSVPQSTAPAPLASDAVLAYLSALETGDAAAALALTADPPGERVLLTSPVLDAAPARVRAISVPSVPDPDATSVQATYRVGSKTVTEEFAVVKVADQWRVRQTYGALAVHQKPGVAYPVRVNGVKVSASQVNAFPAAYRVSTGSRYVSFGNAVVAVRRPSDPPAAITVTPRLTKAGKAAMIAATKKALKKCLRTRTLSPSGCPFAASAAGYTVTPSTLRWKLTNKPFASAKVRLNPGRRYGVSTNLALAIDGSVRCRNSTYNGVCTVSMTRKVTASADLSNGTVRVTWRER